eukprot:4755638-Alexandrium_andersonii.AAC.1
MPATHGDMVDENMQNYAAHEKLRGRLRIQITGKVRTTCGARAFLMEATASPERSEPTGGQSEH